MVALLVEPLASLMSLGAIFMSIASHTYRAAAARVGRGEQRHDLPVGR
ncbi:hypothetical protein ACFPH6_03885 [Streptomyces xiangluensis]|uniref:Uncharacterized protein n=1 Tax=Streptomyces xiangluensis TaxID=2665720 RepID=A0ABV8YHI5_9ACTN